jgi:hypothetical protein
MTPPELTIDPAARARLQAVLDRHPGRRIRLRHDGFG